MKKKYIQNSKILYILIGLLVILSSCTSDLPNEVIYYKSVCMDNPSLSRYAYRIGYNQIEITDSTNRFNIGDSINKHSHNR